MPGVEVVWVGEEVEPDKSLIYVLGSFDTPRYNSLLNKCRCLEILEPFLVSVSVGNIRQSLLNP